MPTAPLIKVLLVEDNPSDVALVRHALRPFTSGLLLRPVPTLQAALKETPPPDVVLMDLNLPDSNGLATFTAYHGFFPEVPVVILTGEGAKELGEEAIRLGAQEYLRKESLVRPDPGDMLAQALRYAIERNALLEAQRGTATGLLVDMNEQLGLLKGNVDKLLNNVASAIQVLRKAP